jgi:uncharacterized membrane protein HdeD (DUF308 family)
MSNIHLHPEPTFPFAGGVLLRALAESWWLLLLRGVAAIIFGVLAFFWPGITLLSLILLWGIYALADGVFALGEALFGKNVQTGPRWWLAVVGLVSLAAGVLTFVWPGMTALVLLAFIAIWAIVIGALQIWGAIQLRKEIDNEWLLVLSGILSIVFGIVLLANPGTGALAVIWLIGAYAIILGCIYIALSFRLRHFKQPA